MLLSGAGEAAVLARAEVAVLLSRAGEAAVGKLDPVAMAKAMVLPATVRIPATVRLKAFRRYQVSG